MPDDLSWQRLAASLDSPSHAAMIRLDIHGQYLRIMALPHASPGQAIDIQPLGSRLAQERSVALFKSVDLEVMRIVLMAGKAWPPHKVTGEITVQCIEGSIEVKADGVPHVLRAGQLLYLTGGVTHGIVALQDSSAIVTVSLRK